MLSANGSDRMASEEDSKRRSGESKKQLSRPETAGGVSCLEMKREGGRERGAERANGRRGSKMQGLEPCTN